MKIDDAIACARCGFKRLEVCDTCANQLADVLGVHRPTSEMERLRERVRELEEKLRWRKWPEEMPEEPMAIWLCTVGGSKGVGYFDGREINDGNRGWNGHVTNWTHWRPIGELPKDGGELHGLLKDIVPELYRRTDGSMFGGE